MSINKFALADVRSGELSGSANSTDRGEDAYVGNAIVELNTGLNGAIMTKTQFDNFVAEINDLCQEAIT
jgi:hypothetical protein